jgi:hypothetical protein
LAARPAPGAAGTGRVDVDGLLDPLSCPDGRLPLAADGGVHRGHVCGAQLAQPQPAKVRQQVGVQVVAVGPCSRGPQAVGTELARIPDLQPLTHGKVAGGRQQAVAVLLQQVLTGLLGLVGGREAAFGGLSTPAGVIGAEFDVVGEPVGPTA